MLQVEFLMSWENENEKENFVFCLQNISLFRILVETWRTMFKAMYLNLNINPNKKILKRKMDYAGNRHNYYLFFL